MCSDITLWFLLPFPYWLIRSVYYYYLFYLKGREKENIHTVSHLGFASQMPTPARSWLGGAEAGTLEFNLGPKYLSCHLLFPKVCIRRRLESVGLGLEPRYSMGFQHPNWELDCYTKYLPLILSIFKNYFYVFERKRGRERDTEIDTERSSIWYSPLKYLQ